MISDAKIENAIRSLAELNIGFYFLVAGSIEIRELEGQYAVDAEYDHVSERVFDTLDEAIKCFIALRHELKCGEDYEFDRKNVFVGDTEYEWYSYVNCSPVELFFVPIVSGVKVPVRIELTSKEQDELLSSKEERESASEFWDVSSHLTEAQASEIIELVAHRGISDLGVFDHLEFKKDRSVSRVLGDS